MKFTKGYNSANTQIPLSRRDMFQDTQWMAEIMDSTEPYMYYAFSYVVQLLSHIWLFETPWTTARHASLSYYLLEFAQIHVHWVSDAIQPSHPLSSPSPPTFNLSQHQGLFQWKVLQFFSSGDQITGASASASVLPMSIQDCFPLGLTGLISMQSKGLANTTVQKHQFFGTLLSLSANSHIHTRLLEKT